jgi:hypothetical protein
MNCQTFEPTINDLARGQMMDARERLSALAHAEECESCSARLADEQALNSSLRTLASSTATLDAPARVETALLAAFRQRQSAVESNGVAPVIEFKTNRTQRWTVWATAAAAAIVTVFAIQALRLRETGPSLHTAGRTAALPAFVPTMATPPVNVASDDSGDEIKSRATPEQTLGQPNLPAMNVAYAPARNRASRRARPAQAEQQAEQEIVTDFMPLTYGATMSPNEGGQLVRVELPRSALASLGLPVNDERSNERVKADVLLGHDGLARAIRFVR